MSTPVFGDAARALRRLYRRARGRHGAEAPRRDKPIEAAYFEALYAADPDPWRFASSPYEAQKYTATLAALPPRRFGSGLEVGCSFGVLTAQLAARCDRLLAIDLVESVLARARAACPGVQFELRRIPEEWPPGRFDLIVLSEVLYYLDAPGIKAAAAQAASAISPGGTILLVHFLGETDYPLTGDEAAALFMAEAARLASVTPGFASRTREYRIDRLDAASPG